MWNQARIILLLEQAMMAKAAKAAKTTRDRRGGTEDDSEQCDPINSVSGYASELGAIGAFRNA